MYNISPEKLIKAVNQLANELNVPGTVPGSDLHLLIELYLTDDTARMKMNRVMIECV